MWPMPSEFLPALGGGNEQKQRGCSKDTSRKLNISICQCCQRRKKECLYSLFHLPNLAGVQPHCWILGHFQFNLLNGIHLGNKVGVAGQMWLWPLSQVTIKGWTHGVWPAVEVSTSHYQNSEPWSLTAVTVSGFDFASQKLMTYDWLYKILIHRNLAKAQAPINFSVSVPYLEGSFTTRK